MNFSEYVEFDFGDITALIGVNGVGKSSVLKLLNELSKISYANYEEQTIGILIGDDDFSNYNTSEPIYIELTFNLDPESIRAKVLQSNKWRIVLEMKSTGSQQNISIKIARDSLDDLSDDEVIKAQTAIGGGSTSDREVGLRMVRGNLNSQSPFSFPSVLFHDGNNLNFSTEVKYILQQLSGSQAQQARNQQEITKLLEPVAKLLGKKSITPQKDTGDTLLIKFDDREHAIEFSKLSSGTQKLIAIFSSLKDGRDILLFDEPENSLHPILQRSLFKKIDKSNKQVIIATHSTVYIDSKISDVVYDFRANGAVTRASGISSLSDIAADLGYRPSDILMANGVIWVEGPTDRIYIKKWIEILEPDIKEGLDFTFQFYGGSLLGRLSVEWPEENDDESSLSILTLNPNYYFVMDSDQDKAFDISMLAPRQQKILDKIDSSLVWVTNCRTIENYLSSQILQTKQFQNPTLISKDLKASKVLFAEKNVQLIDAENYDRYDLNKDIKNLIEVIKSWNE